MKHAKSSRSYNPPQGNVLAKSKKLTIDVPVDDDIDVPCQKFNKNSPVAYKMFSEIKKAAGSIFAPKNRTPSSTQAVKKCYGDLNNFKVNQKVFQFPPSQKLIGKMQIRPTVPFIASASRTKLQPKKFSATPTQRTILEETKKRPKTTSGLEKKPDTGSSPNLAMFLTQVKKPPSSSPQSKNEVRYKEHLFQTFQAMKFVKSLQPINLEMINEKQKNIPRRKGYETKKTLIFDLDETLVHCCEDLSTNKPDVLLPIAFPTGEVIQAGINIRPFALECLQEANKDFEVFVFTASHQCYANVVLDYLDPKNELVHQRFFRDSCISVNGIYFKDLRIFANRNLKDIVIVDNAAYSFGYQVDNGIPIVSWHDDREDKELFNLIDYLKALAAVDDIRDVNEQTFHLRTFYEDYVGEFMASESVKGKK